MCSLGEVTRCNSGGMVTVCHCPFHQKACNDMSQHLKERRAKMMMTKCPTADRKKILVLVKNYYFRYIILGMLSDVGSVSLKSCLSGAFVMEAYVFSRCGRMRQSRVLRPYKQKPSEEKMPGCPRPPYQEI